MSFARDLEEASAKWVTEGLVSAETREQLLRRHPHSGGISRVVGIVAGIGGLTLVAGILLLVAANWEAIPRPVKFGGAATLMAGAFALGYGVRYGLGLRRSGEAVILAGSGAFLGNLALVSQQYNIMTNPSLLLFAFFASMVPMLYLLRSRTYAFFTPLAGVAWISALLADEDSWLQADEFMEAMLFLAGLGATIVAIGAAHRFSRLQSLAAPIEVVGGSLLIFAVFVLGFYRYETLDYPPSGWALATFLTPATLAVPLLTVVAAGRGASGKKQAAIVAAAAVLVGTLAWCMLVGINPRESGGSRIESTGEEAFALYTGGFWIAHVVLAVALGWLAFVTGRDWWLNVSLVAIGIFLMTRYFDLFSKTELRALAFVGAGVLLLVIAALLEGSRRMITAARKVKQ